MREALNLRPTTRTIIRQPQGLFSSDRDLARSLSARVTEGSRLAFVANFAAAVTEAYRRARAISHCLPPLPASIETLPLSEEAVSLAERFGTAIARHEPESAAYLIGAVYATALPEAYRASKGIFYTPPELVERLL